jgi:hypothetical protein
VGFALKIRQCIGDDEPRLGNEIEPACGLVASSVTNPIFAVNSA